MAKVMCSWCHHEIEGEGLPREITFFGRTFVLCPQDFDLIWRGFGGLGELVRAIRTMMSAPGGGR